MSLSKKLLYTVSTVQIISICLFSVIFFRLTINQIHNYEESEIISEVKQINNIINKDIDTLTNSVSDWAFWKDTYDFINNKNEDYIKNNLNLADFEHLNINYMFFIDANNKIKYHKAFDIETGKNLVVDKNLINKINALLAQYKKSDKIFFKNIIRVNDTFIMLSAQPISIDFNSSTPSGVLIFGKTIDNDYLQSVSERANIPLNLAFNYDKSPNEISKIISKNVTLLYNRAPNQILGKIIYSNPNLSDVLLLSFTIPRKIFLFYKIISFENMIIFLFLLLFSGIFLYFMINRQITNRIKNLTNDVIRIGNNNVFSERVKSVKGEDEVSTLSQEINKMLYKLEDFKNQSLEHELNYSKLLESSNKQLKQIIDFLPDATFAIDKEGRVIIWNKAMEDMTKVKADDILGKGNFEYSLPFRNKRIPILVDFVFDKNHILDDCYLNFKRNSDGSVLGESHDVNLGIYTWGKASPLYDSDGNIFAAIETIRDITDKIESEKSLLYQKKFFETLFLRTGDAIAIFNKEGKIIDINENFEKLFGYSKEECIGQDIDSIVTNGNQSFMNEAQEITDSVYKNGYFETEGIRFDKNGNPIDMIIKGVTIRIDGEIIGGFAIYVDISSKKKYENELKYLSLHDNLTGLYNRNYFDNKIVELQSSNEYPISIISIDVNGLKLINDTLGHIKGDELLVKASQILRKAIDVELIFRVGGDEFIIVLPKTDSKVGEQIIKKIMDQFDEYNTQNLDFPINISIGLSTAQDSNDYLLDIYKKADDFMYRNKLIQKTSPKNQMLSTLMSALAERDYITSGHADRVTKLCLKMGQRCGLSSNELTRLTLLGEVHDIGKVGIPDNILFKNGPLNKEEWEIMKQHCEKGYRIALSSPELASVADLILKHHERWDGNGYPLGIKGKEIPIECRILNIVDSYDAMVSDRPYRKGMKKEDAVKEILNNSGKQFDPELVPIFIDIINEDE